MKKWIKKHEKILFQGSHRSMIQKTFNVTDGVGEAEISYDIIRAKSFAIAVCLTEDFQVILIERFLPGLQLLSVGLPGGGIDENEKPENAIRREILEETGYQSDTIIFLKKVIRSAYSEEFEYCFLALNCKKVSKATEVDPEQSSIKIIPLEQFYKLVFDPKEEFLEHIQCGCLALEYLSKNSIWRKS